MSIAKKVLHKWYSDSDPFWHRKLTLKIRILHILTTFTQVTARLKTFLVGWLLVLGLKEGLVECATVCVKSWVILACLGPSINDVTKNLSFWPLPLLLFLLNFWLPLEDIDVIYGWPESPIFLGQTGESFVFLYWYVRFFFSIFKRQLIVWHLSRPITSPLKSF